ncbi:MAG: MCE family protein [Candidatus Omnitrophica bacterium]|nr:MCE family protein [Candidatus Omnitrophota bacterium]
MTFGKSHLELKVGAFVFIGLLILSFFILSIGGVKTWSSGYKVDFVFGFVNGIKDGAPLRYAGVDVGAVQDIKIFFDPKESKSKVKISCWVKKDVKIPVDSTIWVNTLGLLGEKYIEVMPGKDYKNILASNQVLVGKDPMPMQEVTELAKRIGMNLDDAFTRIKNKEGTIGKLLYDDKIYNELDAFIVDISKNPWKLFIKQKEKK